MNHDSEKDRQVQIVSTFNVSVSSHDDEDQCEHKNANNKNSHKWKQIDLHLSKHQHKVTKALWHSYVLKHFNWWLDQKDYLNYLHKKFLEIIFFKFQIEYFDIKKNGVEYRLSWIKIVPAFTQITNDSIMWDLSTFKDCEDNLSDHHYQIKESH